MLRFLRRHLIKNSAERWDMKYARGNWKPLREIHELGHYSIIAGYFQYLKPGGTILDVGCGEGLLQERISPALYSKYTGIDLSAEAIRQAAHKANEKTFFVVADMQKFSTTEMFDAIVFNESIYYVNNRLNVIKHFAEFLADGGIFIFSNFESQDKKISWPEIETLFPRHDETKIINRNGSAAVCKVLMKTQGS